MLVGFAGGSTEQKGKRRRWLGSTLIHEEKTDGNSETWPTTTSNTAGKQLHIPVWASGETAVVSNKQLGGKLLLATATSRDVALLQHYNSLLPPSFSLNFQNYFQNHLIT
jgi:hypothetical protein